MKYAIYDKAADAYLTKMIFDVGYSDNTQFSCALNDYITNAELLDTKKAADAAVVRIERFKFMEKGRFVVHSFDDTLNDQYIISEAGNPTKVIDNITVDLDGTVNVKYGTMTCHWSAMSLEYTVNRLNRLQEAISPKYGSWRATFDIYRVIAIIDEKEHTHYQFINVTEEGLERAEFYKRQANSVYGMIVPTRCCGKQLMADILSGKKIPVDKRKYDDLMECINKISLTYEMMEFTPFSMNRPSWLSGIINRINNLTK